jgi:hypothetical protein
MINLSRSAWIAIAAVTAIPATVAIAKTVEHAGWQRMSPETRQRLDEGKLAMVKTALKLTPDQEKLWTPIEAQARTFFKDREAKMAEREKMRAEREKDRADGKRPDMAEHLEKMSQNMGERAERMKSFSGAFKPFYASLSDEQKDVLRPLARDLMPGMGGRGHGGKRWAFGGGWGGQEGGHHGWGGGGRHHGEHGDRGGPMMDDGGPADGPDQGSAPATDGAKPADKK